MQISDRSGRRMKLQDLHVLMTVVQAGSMSKAAALLNTSQSAISRSVAELEHTMGVPLLDRGARGVEPTHYGRALLKQGVVAFDALKQGVKDIEFLSDPGAGELRIGASAALSEGIVAAVVGRLSRQYPRVVYQIVLGGTIALFEALRSRDVELGFMRMSEPEDDLNHELLYEEPLVVVAGVHSPWHRRRNLKLADLLNEPWTWPAPGTFFDSLVVEAFRNSGLKPPRAALYTDGINMRVKLATTARFLAIVPAGILKFSDKHASVRMLPVELPTSHREIGIVTLKNRTLSPLAQLFIEYARDVARPTTKRK